MALEGYEELESLASRDPLLYGLMKKLVHQVNSGNKGLISGPANPNGIVAGVPNQLYVERLPNPQGNQNIWIYTGYPGKRDGWVLLHSQTPTAVSPLGSGNSTSPNIHSHLGAVVNAPLGGRAAWDTTVQKTSAVDASGNLLLKNIVAVVGTTSNPTTNSTVPAQVPELTITATTKGNKIFLSWAVTFRNSTTGGSVFFQLYLDGASIGPVIDGASPNVAQNMSCAASWIVLPAAGSHTFALYWWVTAGTTATADGTNRVLEAVELG